MIELLYFCVLALVIGLGVALCQLRRCKEALWEFIDTVEDAGGVVWEPSCGWAPEGDPAWTDLGDAYAQACRALGRTPLQPEQSCHE